MPWAERIEEFVPQYGAQLVLVDNSEKINALVKAWNDSQNWPTPGGVVTTGTGGGASSESGGASSVSGGASVDGRADAGRSATVGAGGSAPDDMNAMAGGSGCACR